MARTKSTAVSRTRSRSSPRLASSRAPALVQIAIAVPDAETAGRIALALLEHNLCACAQAVGPVTSRYRWRGALETASEFLLLVKTRAALYRQVETTVRTLHPYELPEILATPVHQVFAGYANWIVESTAPDTGTPSRSPRSRSAPGRRRERARVGNTPPRRRR